MRWRVLAWVSLGVNLVLIVVLLISSRLGGHRAPETQASLSPSPGPIKTNIVLRRNLFSWREVESDDYPTYIANLHDIGCPQQTIRDIIIADVNSMFARRRATEVVTPAQQWWRTEMDTNLLQAAAEKIKELDGDRRALLTRLLGPAWEAGDLASLPRPTRPGIALDGPVLGELPAEVRQAVQNINARSRDRLQEYLEAQRNEGKTPDPAEIAKLRQQTREELQHVLNPAQLEEYLLRYSQPAGNLRTELGQLRFFNVTSNEFRYLFRATDGFDTQIQLLAGATDPNSVAQRKTLQDQRENAIKIALGPARYEEYSRLQDPLYREAMAAAIEAGTPDAVENIYKIKLAAAPDENRIRSDPTLTDQQRNIALKQLELQQMTANALATGQEPPADESAPAPAPPPKRTYVVRPGDNASVVAMIYGVPIAALRAANPSVDLNRLRPGASLNIPSTVVLTPPQMPPLPPNNP